MAVYVHTKIILHLCVAILFTAAGTVYAADDDPEDAKPPDSVKTEYELGQGYHFGDSGLTLGGYTSLQYQDLQNQGSDNAQTSLSHLSMFVWWQNNSHFKMFAEIDNQDPLSADDQSLDNGQNFLAIERLYFDYTINDSVTFRAGKFLAPIGRWNQIHADPLVWTTSRPLITVNLFPEHITGGMALGNVSIMGQEADYTLYLSKGTDIKPDRAQGQFNEAYGARLNLPLNDNLQVGVSYSSFEVTAKPGSNEQLLGMDFIWSLDGFEISAETAWRFSSLGSPYNIKGGFIQSVAPLYGNLFAVGRIESVGNGPQQDATRLGVLGINYRYSRAVSFKAELIHGISQPINDSGFLSSVSVLF